MITSVNDTGVNCSRVVATGITYIAGVVVPGDKLFTGVVETGDKFITGRVWSTEACTVPGWR